MHLVLLENAKLFLRCECLFKLTDKIERYEEDTDRDSNVIEVFIRRLRIKLDPNDTLKPIETLRGRGYRFTLTRT